MLFEEGGIIHRDFQESHGQQELLNTALVKNLEDNSAKVLRILELNQKERELVSK